MGDSVSIEMPRGAKVLSCTPVVDDFDEVFLWAEVDPSQPMESHRIEVYGTGHPISTRGRFVGTVQINDHHGPFVFHLFEAEDQNDD